MTPMDLGLGVLTPCLHLETQDKLTPILAANCLDVMKCFVRYRSSVMPLYTPAWGIDAIALRVLYAREQNGDIRMAMPLDEWDQKVAPHLKGIEFDATWVSHYAGALERRANALAFLPKWETSAEAKASEALRQIAITIKELGNAAMAINRAIHQMKEKPVDE